MRLVIDAFPLIVPSAGIKNYLFYWISHLAKLARGPELALFPWLRVSEVLDHERSPLGRFATSSRVGLLHLLNLPGIHALDLLLSADIFHACRTLNPPRKTRLTATIQDLTCWLMPDFHTPANVAAETRIADRVWRRADGLIAGSQNTLDDAVRLLRLNPERIRVIHHGVADAFFCAGPLDVSVVKQKYTLPDRYVLSVGTIEPRKNLDRALDAYAALPASLRDEYPYVVAGPPGWAAPATLSRLRQQGTGVRYLGYVPEKDLPGLTAGAAVLFYPSLYEGFGFPVAQAMAAGTPVLTSNCSSLPEVAGDAALFADPCSPADLRSNLERLLLSPSLQSRLAQAGRLRSQHYRWERCARESFEFFQSLC
jgi:glycosyltransferase involved in cell wall biosynthesis